ncbi:hypothetical protein RI129_005785 [Pyrocoelia pectoralis]|uniref:Histone-lysine N-methyltransferase n=1 Tax=Pyrocoelia pectoralis TaxID=417401 RepID=A0AAN7V9I7_9COLE
MDSSRNSDIGEVKSDGDLSAELHSPISKSRYGRTRKPKISEDFYDIDVIFESSKDFNKKVPRPQPQIIKSVKTRQSISPKKIKDSKKPKFEHVTADLELTENIVENHDSNSKAIHNFFKTESGMSVLHNTEILKLEPKCESKVTSDTLNLEPVDVTQVLKIITAKNNDEKFNTEVKMNSKPVLKTYSNKRKNKLVVVESFGLPDTPIFPIDSEKSSPSEPKRIKNLDVAAPSSENDINLVDKKLLHTPWKIASMDAEIPDLDLLMESTCDDYREDSLVSPIKILNEVPSIFVESCVEFEADSTFLGVDQRAKIPSSPTTRSKVVSKDVPAEEEKEADIFEEDNTTLEKTVVDLNENRNQSCTGVEFSVPDSSQENESENRLGNNKSDLKADNHAISDTSTISKVSPSKHLKKRFKSTTRQKILVDKVSEHSKLTNNEESSSKEEEENAKLVLPPGKKSPRNLASTLRLMSCTEKATPFVKRIQKVNSNALKKDVCTTPNISERKGKYKGLQSPELNTKIVKKSPQKSIVKNTNEHEGKSPSKIDKGTRKVNQSQPLEAAESPEQTSKKKTSKKKDSKVADVPSIQKSAVQSPVAEVKRSRNPKNEKKTTPKQEGKEIGKFDLTTKDKEPSTDTKLSKSTQVSEQVPVELKTTPKTRKKQLNQNFTEQLPVVVNKTNSLQESDSSQSSSPQDNKEKKHSFRKLRTLSLTKTTLRSPSKKLQPVVLLNSNDINTLSSNYTKRKRQLLSLIRKAYVKPWLKPADVTPLATSPIRAMSYRRTHSQPVLNREGESEKRKIGRRSVSSGHTDNKIQEFKSNSMGKIKKLKNMETVIKRKRGRPRSLRTVTTPLDNEEETTVVGDIDLEVKRESLDKGDELDVKGKLIMLLPVIFSFVICAVQTLYHVRFFGDKGRRSWVHSTFLLLFRSANDLKQQFKIAKNKANFIVKPSALPKWKIAVGEAESQLKCSIQDRLDFFTNMFAQKDMLKFDIKQEDLQAELSADPKPVNISEKSKRRSKKSLKVSASPDPTILKKPQKKAKKLVPDEKVVGEIDTDETKVKSELDIVNPPELISDLKMPWKTFDGSEKNDIYSEYSSDTDTASKSSTNTVIADGFQDEVMRQKRNSLFRGISKDRVCQVCKQAKDVFKCKGPCRGLYHYRCADFDIKPDITDALPSGTNNTDVGETDPHVKSVDLTSVSCPPQQVKFSELSIAEQIDIKMKEMMQGIENDTRYADSTTDYSSSEESTCNLLEKINPPQEEDVVIVHVTADHISVIPKKLVEDALPGQAKLGDVNKNVVEQSADTPKVFQCGYCIAKVEPPCFACGKDSMKNESLRQKCSLYTCGKFYHRKCIKLWPQTQWSLISTEKHKKSDKLLDTFICPFHMCHTCTSDDPRAATSRCYSRKLAKCLHCPAAYHTTNYCIPAGTQILSTSQIICPRHFNKDSAVKKRILKQIRTVNTPWCFICSKGGDLICCETCPTSVHTDCLTINLLDDDTFICEDCESGRFPLYDEIVWVKLGKYRWWPAVILFPNEVPDNVRLLPHNSGEFAVKFFGTHDHYWVGRGRVFLFQEGDKGHCSPSKKRVDTLFKKSIEEATIAHTIKKSFRKSKVDELKNDVKPPPYIRVKVNRPVGNVRLFDGNVSNTTPCECNPLQENSCGPDSDCLNRLLLTECDPNICPAKDKCNNQRFEKRQYPPLVPYKTEGRGWGLKTLAPINKGDFVIEYVGEIIDDQEYQRRVKKMSEQKDENYYFLTIDPNRIIDAGPKGNLARFMNHCCQPNCVTQKWTVHGDTRVGLFAIENIAADSEVTFNYNLECIGKEKKICKCGAPKCSGFIGVKVKDETQKKIKKSSGIKNKKPFISHTAKNDGPCFVCNKSGETKEEQKSETSDIVKNFRSSKLTTDETDVTSTTCDETDAIAVVNTVPATLVTSTPIKKSQVLDSSEINEPHPCKETPQSSIPESNDESTLVSVKNAKRKKGRPKKRSLKKVKLTHSNSKQNLNYIAPNLLDMPLQNEVKLSSSIPTRHLRTRSNAKSIVSKRFLKQQNELEKDLPIRKRSRPRCEVTL